MPVQGGSRAAWLGVPPKAACLSVCACTLCACLAARAQVLDDLEVSGIPVVTAWNKIDACANPAEVRFPGRMHHGPQAGAAPASSVPPAVAHLQACVHGAEAGGPCGTPQGPTGVPFAQGPEGRRQHACLHLHPCVACVHAPAHTPPMRLSEAK